MLSNKKSVVEVISPALLNRFRSFDESGEPVPKKARKMAEQEDRLWRLPPEESFSDWKIVIKDESARENDKSFHVHKNVLATGPRQSEYFATLFKGAVSFREGNTSTTQLTLPSFAFDAFEPFLDFVYCGRVSDLVWDANNFVGLRHLAMYLRVPCLFDVVVNKIMENLLDSCGVTDILEAGVATNDRDIIKMALEAWPNSCEEIGTTGAADRLSKKAALLLFGSSKVQNMNSTASRNHCCHFASYCQKNRKEVTFDFFERACRHIPFTFYGVTAYVIRLSLEIEEGEGRDGALEQFRERCRDACKEQWNNVEGWILHRDTTRVSQPGSEPSCWDWTENYYLLSDSEKLKISNKVLEGAAQFVRLRM